MHKILTVLGVVVALTGCGSEEDIMGYSPEMVPAQTIDVALISDDPDVQKEVLRMTEDTTDNYQSKHKAAIQKHLNRKERLESEFASLAKRFEEDCMAQDRMKDTPHCIAARDKALAVDEAIRKERVRHIDELNRLKGVYSQEINKSLTSINK